MVLAFSSYEGLGGWLGEMVSSLAGSGNRRPVHGPGTQVSVSRDGRVWKDMVSFQLAPEGMGFRLRGSSGSTSIAPTVSDPGLTLGGFTLASCWVCGVQGSGQVQRCRPIAPIGFMYAPTGHWHAPSEPCGPCLLCECRPAVTKAPLPLPCPPRRKHTFWELSFVLTHRLWHHTP